MRPRLLRPVFHINGTPYRLTPTAKGGMEFHKQDAQGRTTAIYRVSKQQGRLYCSCPRGMLYCKHKDSLTKMHSLLTTVVGVSEEKEFV